MIFEKKKIQIETLSEYLSAVRLNLNLSQDEVCRKTGITLKFLNALETGNLKILPADVYVFGFLKQIALLYIIDADVLLDQYKKERGIVIQISKQPSNFTKSWGSKYFGKLIVTPKVLSFVFGAAFVVASVGYIIWQVWSINRTPSLEIYEPANNAVVSASFVKIQGKTDPGMSVTVNDQIIFVNNKGEFQTQLGLSPGPKEVVVTAKNRFDKSFSKTLSITGSAPITAIPASEVQLRADFSDMVTITFILDDSQPQTLSFNKGDSKVFLANRQVLLSTTDAGATKITLNGQVLGSMGRAKEALNNVSFFAQATSTPINK